MTSLAKAAKESGVVTQENFVQGCVTVANLTFKPYKFTSPQTSVNGTIINDCGRDVTVSITVQFFDGHDNLIDTKFAGKLSRSGTVSEFISDGEYQGEVGEGDIRFRRSIKNLPNMGHQLGYNRPHEEI